VNTAYNVLTVNMLNLSFGTCGSAVVKALCYKPEGRGLRPGEVNEFSQFT
jgi:hypothetical protein